MSYGLPKLIGVGRVADALKAMRDQESVGGHDCLGWGAERL